MKSITDAEKKLYDEQFNMRDILLTFDGFTVGNDNITSESMTFEEMICENSSLKFGSCNASSFSIEIKDTEHEYKGKRFKAEMITEGIHRTIGYFTVAIDNKTDDKLRRKITAYDAIYGAKDKDVSDWYLGLTFPMTLKAFRDSFFTYLGITQVDVALVNDDMTVEKTLSPTTMSALTVMEAICEINACFGHINSDGEFEYINLFERMGNKGDAFSPYSIEYKMGSLKYEEFRCKHITQVTIRQEDNDIGCTVGEDGNTYVIQGNFLCYGKVESELAQIAENFMSEAYFYEYTPASVSTRGRPYMELGDFVKAVAQNGDTVVFPILRRSMNGIIALMDKYESKGTERFDEKKYTLSEQVQQIKGKSNVLTRTIEETKSEIKELDNNIKNNYSTTTDTKSLIDANAKDIKLEISDETDKKLQDYYTSEQTDTQINLSKDGIMQSVEQKIEALGSIYPSEDLYPSTDLFSANGFTTTAEVGAVVNMTAEMLQTRIYDDLHSNYYTKKETANEISARLTSYVDNDTYESYVSATAKEISAKLATNDLITEFNASAEKVELKSNRLIVESTNFKLSADGTVEAKNGKFSGTVTATEGNVGGWNIGSHGMYNDDLLTGFINAGRFRIYAGRYTYAEAIKASGTGDNYPNFGVTEDGLAVMKQLVVTESGASVEGGLYVNGGISVASGNTIKGSLRSTDGWTGNFWYSYGGNKTTVYVDSGIITQVVSEKV
ncbi:MAG: hypothetical protein SPJ65_05960 [Roseburia sp.]|nr:hypothetical protein [Roseburia sp.]